MSEPFYTIAEVAGQLKLSQKSIRRYIAANELNAIKIGTSYRIPISALENFINKPSNTEKQVQYDLFGNPIAEPLSCSKTIKSETSWIDISQYWDSPTPSDLTFVDLFCGAGGLSKGLEMSGLQGICGLDWFKEAGETYRRNFNHPFVNGDITLPEVKEEFYNTVKQQLNGRPLNVIAGGFPVKVFRWQVIE